MVIGCTFSEPPKVSTDEAPSPPAHGEPTIPGGAVTSDESGAQVATKGPVGFAGFSGDGSHFAYQAPSLSGSGSQFMWVTDGPADAEIVGRVSDTRESDMEIKAFLDKGGYSTRRLPVPGGLRMTASLATTPPSVTLTLDGRTKRVELGKYPFPPTDIAELWSVSPNGKMVAIYIHGPLVKGALLPNPPKGTAHFFRLVPLP